MNAGAVEGKKKSSRRGKHIKLDICVDVDSLGCEQICKDMLQGPISIDRPQAGGQIDTLSRGLFGQIEQNFSNPRKARLLKDNYQAKRGSCDAQGFEDMRRSSFGSVDQLQLQEAKQLTTAGVPDGVGDFNRSSFGMQKQGSQRSGELDVHRAGEISRDAFGRIDQGHSLRRSELFCPQIRTSSKLNNTPCSSDISSEHFIEDISRNMFGSRSQSNKNNDFFSKGTLVSTKHAFGQLRKNQNCVEAMGNSSDEGKGCSAMKIEEAE